MGIWEPDMHQYASLLEMVYNCVSSLSTKQKRLRILVVVWLKDKMCHEFITKTIKLTLINSLRTEGGVRVGLSKFCYNFETSCDITIKLQPRAPNFLRDLKTKETTLITSVQAETKNLDLTLQPSNFVLKSFLSVSAMNSTYAMNLT